MLIVKLQAIYVCMYVCMVHLLLRDIVVADPSPCGGIGGVVMSLLLKEHSEPAPKKLTSAMLTQRVSMSKVLKCRSSKSLSAQILSFRHSLTGEWHEVVVSVFTTPISSCVCDALTCIVWLDTPHSGQLNRATSILVTATWSVFVKLTVRVAG